MASYFRQVPDFEYVNRHKDASIGDYVTVKNLFKRGKLREDIFQNLAFFTKYKIQGNDRPDNVAYNVYNDATLDWLVLICNNIMNVQTEWPLLQRDFDSFLLDKYGDYNTLFNGIHHYKTKEVKSSQGVTIIPAGLEVQNNFSVNYFDFYKDQVVNSGNISVPVTNYEYEEKIEDNKRNIWLIKQRYVPIVVDDMEEIMKYKKGSTQYVSKTLKKGDDIRLSS